MERRGVFVCLLTIWYRGTPLPPGLVESMGYGVTLAEIFGAKGLTAKILKAWELARGFGT